MNGVLSGILRRYGQSVALEDGGQALAFVQPILERSEQELPTPLGRRRTDRFLYLGAPELELRCGMGLTCGGKGYRVCCAQPIRVGTQISHWWAVLRPEDEK